jgi:hypothetical protein
MRYQIRRGHFKGVGLHYRGFTADIPIPANANADSAPKIAEDFKNLRRLG